MRHLFLLLILFCGTALAGGAADKATGSGQFYNGAGRQMYVDFNAHEAVDNRPVKGDYYQEILSGGPVGSWSIDVDYADVRPDIGRACFGGTVYAATGSLARFVNGRAFVAVQDGGSGQNETGMDLLRAGYSPSGQVPQWCTNWNCGRACQFGSNQYWGDGNAQIHPGRSYVD